MSAEPQRREGFSVIHPFDEIFFVTPYGWQPPQRLKQGWLLHPSKSTVDESNAVQSNAVSSMNFGKMRRIAEERELVCDSCAVHVFCLKEIVDVGFPEVMRLLQKVDPAKGQSMPELDRIFVSLHCMCKKYLDSLNSWSFWLDRCLTELRILCTIVVLMESRDIKWPKPLLQRGFDKDYATYAVANEMIAMISTIWDAVAVDVCPYEKHAEISDVLSLCEVVCVMFNPGPYDIGELMVEGLDITKEVVVCDQAKNRSMLLMSFYSNSMRKYLDETMTLGEVAKSLQIITDAFFDHDTMRGKNKFQFYFVQATDPLLEMLRSPRPDVRSILCQFHETFFHEAFNETFDSYVALLHENLKDVKGSRRSQKRGRKKSGRSPGLSGLLKMQSAGGCVSESDLLLSYEDLELLKADKMALEMIASERVK